MFALCVHGGDGLYLDGENALLVVDPLEGGAGRGAVRRNKTESALQHAQNPVRKAVLRIRIP